MKSILYVGATLMIGASIYGFVDYKKTSHSKEFKDMYVEEKVKEPVVVISDNKIERAVKNEVITKAKKAITKKKVIKEEEETIAPVRPIAEDEKMNVGEVKNFEEASVTVTPSKEDLAKKTIKKRKKISTKLFSRAPLREEVDLPQPVKNESKKTKDKER